MTGDAFMVQSSERIRACEHCVIMKSKVTRYFLGLFSYNSKMVQALEDLVMRSIQYARSHSTIMHTLVFVSQKKP
ncbi:hypothetical protein JHK82_044271 [Glycine max]|nr:hypothetical protein JHK86_044619 [Glycine max]KAG4940590.1 hypothetical protein JHK87_044461 [Glycine soja]KAG4951362.1 hypothetical protein JHK85_045229 [Glycine max]KAG5099219.1 hypothetical protein JHK82_044271 [Glycine max]KAG5107825.1 hypothetical protein JHK84_044732 [Glycine max]